MTDIAPPLALIKDSVIVWKGVNPVTHKEVSDFDIGLSAGMIFFGVAPLTKMFSWVKSSLGRLLLDNHLYRDAISAIHDLVGRMQGVVESAKDFGVPANRVGDFAESASKSGMWASGRRVGTEPASLLRDGKLEAKDISDIIPDGTPNTWNPSSGTNFEKGFKYEWNHNGTRYHVHGHTKNASTRGANDDNLFKG